MTGAELIAVERRRQVEQEGWTASHDDEHDQGELAIAAGSYLLMAYVQVDPNSSIAPGTRALMEEAPENWPWNPGWWKPDADPIRNLTKAGALIAAEIDRLQRVEGDDG